ncbi:MAG: hypothetical protein H6Q70_3918 [Firmicutes bacterium]|nr:hypothetical protein [Bacillota bacterium]
MEIDGDFYTLSSNELLSLNLILTILLANGLNANQLNILGNFIAALGQNILFLQAVVDALPEEDATYQFNPPHCDTKPVSSTFNQGAMTNLQKEVLELKAKLTQLEKELSFKET